MFLNYPNNPTGAVVPDGFFERVVSFAREHEILVVHDNAYSETTYDGYVAPSFLDDAGRQGGRGRGLLALEGLQHDRLALRGDPRQRRGDQTYWRLKTNVDSGLFEAVQLAGAAALNGPREPLEEMNEIYARRRDLVVDALREIGVEVDGAEGHDLRMGAGPRRPHLDLVRRARPRRGGGDRLARLDVRAERRGLLPHLPHHPRRPHLRSGRADARAPQLRNVALGSLGPVAVETAPLVLGRQGLQQLGRYLRVGVRRNSLAVALLVFGFGEVAGQGSPLRVAALALAPGGGGDPRLRRSGSGPAAPGARIRRSRSSPPRPRRQCRGEAWAAG